ncbi:MAG: efflux RND transporter periplasmic adaptor subunit, partial [Vicinamibacterales bacterium]
VRMRLTRVHIAVAGVTVAVAGLIAVALRPTTEPVDLGTVVRGPLEVTIEDEGRTRVRDRFIVSAPAAGRVLRLTLQPGDRVRRGDVVARLQPGLAPLLDARARAEADAAVTTARAVVGRARAEAARSAETLAYAERELKRSRELAREGLAPAQEVEAREAEARLAGDAARAATFSVEAAEADLRRAEARVAPAAARQAAALDVRAPATGVVLRRIRESESVVPAGEPLVEIGDASQLEVVVDLLSTDATRVAPGTRARVEQPGLPPLPARVRLVEPAGFTKISALGVEEQRVNVILDFEPGAALGTLGDAFRVDVRLVVWETANTLVVPATALFRTGDQWAAYVVADGLARRTTVKVGQHGGRAVQVLDGLSEGAQVILHPGDRVTDGVRVAPRAP